MGARPFPWEQDCLETRIHASGTISATRTGTRAMRQRLREKQNLQSRIHCNLRYLINSDTSAELRRFGGKQPSVFKLQVTNRRQCRGRGYRRSGWIAFWNLLHTVLGAGERNIEKK